MMIVMKVLVLVVLLCLAGVDAKGKRGKNPIKAACIEEHGFNATHVETLKTVKQLQAYLPLDKWICVFACMLERNLMGDGETSYQLIYDSIDKDIPVTVGKWNPKEMKDMLNKCKAKHGENGCKFLKCLKVDEEPFDSYLRIPTYYLEL